MSITNLSSVMADYLRDHWRDPRRRSDKEIVDTWDLVDDQLQEHIRRRVCRAKAEARAATFEPLQDAEEELIEAQRGLEPFGYELTLRAVQWFGVLISEPDKDENRSAAGEAAADSAKTAMNLVAAAERVRRAEKRYAGARERYAQATRELAVCLDQLGWKGTIRIREEGETTIPYPVLSGALVGTGAVMAKWLLDDDGEALGSQPTAGGENESARVRGRLPATRCRYEVRHEFVLRTPECVVEDLSVELRLKRSENQGPIDVNLALGCSDDGACVLELPEQRFYLGGPVSGQRRTRADCDEPLAVESLVGSDEYEWKLPRVVLATPRVDASTQTISGEASVEVTRTVDARLTPPHEVKTQLRIDVYLTRATA